MSLDSFAQSLNSWMNHLAATPVVARPIPLDNLQNAGHAEVPGNIVVGNRQHHQVRQADSDTSDEFQDAEDELNDDEGSNS